VWQRDQAVPNCEKQTIRIKFVNLASPLLSRLRAAAVTTPPSSAAPLRYGRHPRHASPFALPPPCLRFPRTAAVSPLVLRPIAGGFALFSMAAAASSASSVHDFTVKDASGKDVDLSTYKGKVLLIVNVASQWYGLLLP